MPTAGLTGNFGMGKTTVLKIFENMGAKVFDADAYVREILSNSKIVEEISEVLGDGVLSENGSSASLDKRAVAEAIFHDDEKRKAVERIIHPRVLERMKAVKDDLLGLDPSALIIFEVPLLFEAGYEDMFDRTIVVHTERDTVLNRLAAKSVSCEDALNRLKTQWSISRKKEMADYCIDNNGDLTDTERQVRWIFGELQKEL